MFASLYRQYYKDILNIKAQRLAIVACVLNVLENLALIGLTFITSAYNYGKHMLLLFLISFLLIFLSYIVSASVKS
jgi:hypothetical protein